MAELLRIEEACARLGVSKSTLRRMVQRGELATKTVSKRSTRILSVDVDYLVAQAKPDVAK